MSAISSISGASLELESLPMESERFNVFHVVFEVRKKCCDPNYFANFASRSEAAKAFREEMEIRLGPDVRVDVLEVNEVRELCGRENS